MNHKDKALRIAFTMLRTMANDLDQGKPLPFTAAELRTVGDLCAIALPAKYRFTREELDRMHGIFMSTKPQEGAN